MRTFSFVDTKGQRFEVEALDFYRQLESQAFTIFGVDYPGILEFHRQYQLRYGPHPVTVATIRQTFGGA